MKEMNGISFVAHCLMSIHTNPTMTHTPYVHDSTLIDHVLISAVLESALNPPSKYKTSSDGRNTDPSQLRDANVIPSKTPKKCQRLDVEMAVYMTVSGLAENQFRM